MPSSAESQLKLNRAEQSPKKGSTFFGTVHSVSKPSSLMRCVSAYSGFKIKSQVLAEELIQTKLYKDTGINIGFNDINNKYRP